METVQPLTPRARWATVALGAVIVSDVFAIVFDVLAIRLMDRVIGGEDIAVSTLDADDTRQAAVASVQLLVFAVAVVFFVRWFHRAYVNLGVLGGTRRYRTAWAIASWFTPFLNLWRPKQIANDIWRSSDPSSFWAERGAASSSTPNLLRFWWAAWLVAGYVMRIAGLGWANTSTAVDAGASATGGYVTEAEDIQHTAMLDLAGGALDIVAAVLAILVIRRMTARQLSRAVSVEAARDSGSPDAVRAPGLA